MAQKHVPVESLAEALSHGFKPLSEVSPEFRALIEEALAAKRREFAEPISQCGPGHDPAKPCRDYCYSNGVREICFCSPANQCDNNCVYGKCEPY